MAWLKYQYNYRAARLNLIKGETEEQHLLEQQILLDKCAQLYQQIQEQEFELRQKLSLTQSSPSSATD